jgi:hypothetical protein
MNSGSHSPCTQFIYSSHMLTCSGQAESKNGLLHFLDLMWTYYSQWWSKIHFLHSCTSAGSCVALIHFPFQCLHYSNNGRHVTIYAWVHTQHNCNPASYPVLCFLLKLAGCRVYVLVSYPCTSRVLSVVGLDWSPNHKYVVSHYGVCSKRIEINKSQ